MYKVRVLLGLVIVMFLLSGCEYDEATDENAETKSEYLAYYVLYNEKNYTGRLITEEPKSLDSTNNINNEDNNTKDDNNKQDEEQVNLDDEYSGILGNIKSNEQFTDLIGYDGLTIEYDSYETKATATDGIIELKADKGFEYYIVYFKLTNNSSKNISLNLSDSKITYQLHINLTSAVYKAQLNLLTNDIRFLNTEIKAGETYLANALFQVPSDVLINDLELIIEFDNKSFIYKLK